MSNERDRENFKTCKRIALELEQAANGELYKDPETGAALEAKEDETSAHETRQASPAGNESQPGRPYTVPCVEPATYMCKSCHEPSIHSVWIKNQPGPSEQKIGGQSAYTQGEERPYTCTCARP